jgi:hypothetical protein
MGEIKESGMILEMKKKYRRGINRNRKRERDPEEWNEVREGR